MKSITLFLPFCCSSLFTSAQFNSENLKSDFGPASVYAFEKLRLYPVKANDLFLIRSKNMGRYINLETAIKENKIKITEVNASGEVNTLYVENISKDTIYIMPGEIVKGGKQDRLIAQDFILSPDQKVDVSAFCVEYGRWSTDGSVYGISMDGINNLSSQELSEVVVTGNFKEHKKVASVAVRKKAVVEKDQMKVWNEVALTTSKNKASGATGSYNSLDSSKSYQAELEKYLEKFSSAFDRDSTIVGVVAASGNKVIGCDLFATHDLFALEYNSLLNSYVTEAITNGKAVTISDAEVQMYLDAFLSNELNQDENLKGKGSLYKHNGKTIRITVF